jgi:SET domain-containing protein
MTGFVSMLKDINVSVEQLQTITKSGKVVEFNSHVYYKDKSLIHGQGVFAKKNIAKGEVIGLGCIDGKYKTTLGRYTNHSDKNNAMFYYLYNNDVIMIAEKNILKFSEILINYRDHVNEKHLWIPNKTFW